MGRGNRGSILNLPWNLAGCPPGRACRFAWRLPLNERTSVVSLIIEAKSRNSNGEYRHTIGYFVSLRDDNLRTCEEHNIRTFKRLY